MPFKTLTIKESSYRRIKAAKKKGESFSDIIDRTFPEEKPDLLKYAGILSKKEGDEAWKNILEYRERFNKDAKRRMKDVMSRL